MENNGNDNLPPTSLCKAGCGFFGNASFDGMCSKCFKDAVKRKQASPNVAASASSLNPSSLVAMSVSPSPSTPPPQQAKDSCMTDGPSGVSSPLVSPAGAVSMAGTSLPNVSAGSTTMPVPVAAREEDGGSAHGSGPEEEGLSASPGGTPDDSPAKKKRTRCSTCKKRVGLTGFQCRCGGMFCSLHRYSDKHNCTFDYREHGAEMIRKNNPVVVGEKVAKI